MSDLTYIILYVSACIGVAASMGLCFIWILRVPLQALIERLRGKYLPNKLNKEQINKIKR